MSMGEVGFMASFSIHVVTYKNCLLETSQICFCKALKSKGRRGTFLSLYNLFNC